MDTRGTSALGSIEASVLGTRPESELPVSVLQWRNEGDQSGDERRKTNEKYAKP